ncbi:MAG: hypothetical protein QOJ26_1149, partial [Thermoplasmata archaeon]|nr:hypothetical protein [Thermoplasmata archaeon]
MERLLAAHGAEDALEPRDEPAGEPDRATADPAPSVD